MSVLEDNAAAVGTNNPVAFVLANGILAEVMGQEQFRNAMEILYTSSSSDDDDTDDNSFDAGGGVEGVQHERQRPIRSRVNNGRRLKTECNWWKSFLAPEKKRILEEDDNGREAINFRRMFRVPYDVYKHRLLTLAITRWWPEWHSDKLDSWGRPVGDLELKILGALYILGSAASPFVVSSNTNLSEEVHRVFFLDWIEKMSSLKDEFIYLPRHWDEYDFVVGEYAEMGLPGCVGSIDCVHIGWDMCPVQHKNLYTGKEGYPSIAYEVICTSRKFIQSVSPGHPGSRNDKHIARTDPAVMQLLQGNGWLQSQSWECVVDASGRRKVFYGVYLICDGGYHRWPCFVYPIKTGLPGSPAMKCSAMIESVRKDIEGVFGILKQRFHFLKSFNKLRRQINIDQAFTTCCILHNILLEEDGYLEPDFPDLPNGVRERLRQAGGDIRGEAMWRRQRGAEDLLEEEDRNRYGHMLESTRLTVLWQQRTEALMNHFQFRSRGQRTR
jgi:Plant transposon protein